MQNHSSSTTIRAELHAELRSIARYLIELRLPICRFEEREPRVSDCPMYYVHFDDQPRLDIQGLQMQVNELQLPDERISDLASSCAKAIWHIKDRLKIWCKDLSLKDDVEEHAGASPDMLICADLANWKKHGKNRNRSKCNPQFGLVNFDTSGAGIIELFYDGATKRKELLVSNPLPLPFSIPVIASPNSSEIGDAVDIFTAALEWWKPFMTRLRVFEGNAPDVKSIRLQLGIPKKPPHRTP